MEKIDFLNCDEFKLIKKLMGISNEDKINFTMDVSADDPNLEISSEGIIYKGRRVILYIRDQAQYSDKISEYKFHLIECATLKAMRKQNRYGKYVVSTSTTGIFKVNRIINNRSVEIEEEMHVCKHCLRRLNQKGYNFTYENFSIEEFFRGIFLIVNRSCKFIIKTNVKMIAGNRIWKFYVLIVIKRSIIIK